MNAFKFQKLNEEWKSIGEKASKKAKKHENLYQ